MDLLDRDGETLEQYRVISFAVGAEVQGAMRGCSRPTCRRCCRCQRWRTSSSAGHRLAAGRGGRGGAQSSQIAKRCRAGRIPALQRRSVQLLGQRQPGGQRSGQQYYRQGAAPFRPKYARATKSLSWANCRRLRLSASPTAFLSRYRRNDERVGHGGFVATGRNAAAL